MVGALWEDKPMGAGNLILYFLKNQIEWKTMRRKRARNGSLYRVLAKSHGWIAAKSIKRRSKF